jgi:hypothetical protein
VAHRDRLEPLDRDGDLLPAWTDPGGGVLSEPADDLLGGAVLCRLVGGGDVGMEFSGQRPRLGPVHDQFDEPHRVRVGP